MGILTWMSDTLELVARHGYVLLFFWVLAEQAALPIPSAPLLIVSGSLARTGRLDLAAVVTCVIAASLLADTAWFQLGRRFSTSALQFICKVSLEPDTCVRRTENMFTRHGLYSLFVSKFVPGFNTVAAPLAGASTAPFGKFLVFDAIGSMFWAGAYVFIGYLFADQLEIAVAYASRFGYGFVAVVAAAFAAWITWKFLERRRFLNSVGADRIGARELENLLSAGSDVTILDVRSNLTRTDLAIAGAVHIPLEDLSTRHHEIPRDRDIVVFCT
jgi:membrane protein DedA with SNARE-associated domain